MLQMKELSPSVPSATTIICLGSEEEMYDDDRDTGDDDTMVMLMRVVMAMACICMHNPGNSVMIWMMLR